MGEETAPRASLIPSYRLQLNHSLTAARSARMDADPTPGPPKRRRTSSLGSTSHALPPPSPRRRSSGASANAEGFSRAKGKQVDRNPLAGFDDREEEEEVVGAGVVDEPVDEDEHCAICLSPIVNMVRPGAWE